MKISKYRLFMALLISLACLLSSGALAQMNNSVTIQNFAFQPNNLTVPVGTTVTWTNHDTVQHTVTSDNGAFDSGNIMPNNQFSHKFNQSGSYAYHCMIHPTMHGQIQVASGSSMSNASSANMSKDPDQSMASMYSQYYTMPSGASPKTHITAPRNYQMKNMESTTIYFIIPKQAMTYASSQNYAMMPSSQYQVHMMPYSQYQQNYATYMGGNSLWIQGTSGLTQYVVVPQGASLSLVAITPNAGNGYLYETAPGNKLTVNSYYFYPYNQMDFYADTIGQHILLFVIDDKVSNAIIINVVNSAGYQQPSYQQQPSYNQQSSQQSSYQAPTNQQSSYSQPSSNYQSTGY